MSSKDKNNSGIGIGRPDDGIESYLWHFRRDPSRLQMLGTPVDIPKNTILVEAGEVPRYAYYILRGRVISFEYTASGNERVYAFSEENSLIMEECVLFRYALPVAFKTQQPTSAIRIDRETLLQTIMSEPDFAMDIIHSLSDKFLSAMQDVRHSTNTSASWKICNLLLTFADNYGVPYDGKVLIEDKISQQMIANILGLNRITTLRVLKDLKDMGLIEQINGHYCIRDLAKLERHMDYLESE